MDDLMLKTKRYLEGSLDLLVEISPIDLSAKLPYLYTEHYRFYELMLNEENYLLFEGRKAISGKTVEVHSKELERRFGYKAVFLNDHISSSLRRTLVEHRVAFIIPDNQIYLPKLGISFKEQYLKRSNKKDRLRPATQVILIRALLNREHHPVTASEYAKQISYTAMSISRAFNELLGHGLITRAENWKERPINWLYTGRELWEKALPLMINPVSRSIWVQFSQKASYCVAGISALARYSMIDADDFVTYATISTIAKNNMNMIKIDKDGGSTERANNLQIWRYDPKLITQKDIVDPLSLYLSLKDNHDERVQISLDKMMGGIQW
ncbi:MAG: hypothetical protein M0Q16_02900 [Candidatus Cloacimonetes bacterium]|jgi:DNA-binding MarR family transcriptional regulator|nr:hypothetical protein [Candidatus Cloacimonadota bacterium]